MSRRDHGSHGQRGAAPSAPKRPALNEYWIDGEGILREVLQSEICRFLGAEATCRPGDLNVRSLVCHKLFESLTSPRADKASRFVRFDLLHP
jgi:hypothetical protein